MKKFITIFLSIVALTIGLSSCLKDKAGEVNDEELITTLKLAFTPVTGGPTVTYLFDDPDGPGGVAPVQDIIKLNAGTTYNVQITLLNNSALPPEDITLEVIEEAIAHRFYYAPEGNTAITVTNLDNDSNGIPVGVNSTWTTGAIGNGTIKITLRHYGASPPNKELSDPVNSAKSSSDIELTFVTNLL
jgi:hypothetical protein